MTEVKAYDRPHDKIPGEVLRVLVSGWSVEGLQAVAGHSFVLVDGFVES